MSWDWRVGLTDGGGLEIILEREERKSGQSLERSLASQMRSIMRHLATGNVARVVVRETDGAGAAWTRALDLRRAARDEDRSDDSSAT